MSAKGLAYAARMVEVLKGYSRDLSLYEFFNTIDYSVSYNTRTSGRFKSCVIDFTCNDVDVIINTEDRQISVYVGGEIDINTIELPFDMCTTLEMMFEISYNTKHNIKGGTCFYNVIREGY